MAQVTMFESILMRGKVLHALCVQCWWHGEATSQGISRNGIKKVALFSWDSLYSAPEGSEWLVKNFRLA